MLTLSQFRHAISQINDMSFIGFEKYKMGNILADQLFQLSRNSIPLITILKMLLSSCLYKGFYYEHVKNHESKILFAYTHDYLNRPDHESSFLSVYNLLDNQDLLMAHKQNRKICIRNFLSIFKCIPWYFQLSETNFTVAQKMFLATAFLRYYDWKSYIENNINPENYRCLVTYCDGHGTDNFLSQHFINHNIQTATLQHGPTRENTEYLFSNNFLDIISENLVSDYLLLWGEHSKQEAIKNNTDSFKMRVVGSLKDVSTIPNVNISSKNPTNVIGIILAVYTKGNSSHSDNLKLLEISENYAKIHNMTCLIRVHPQNYLNYKDTLNLTPHMCVAPPYQNVADFAQCCSFIVCVSSTSLIFELIQMDCPLYLLDDEPERAIVRNVSLPHFSNLNELCDVTNVVDDEIISNLNKTRNYLCQPNSKDNYKLFLQSFLI